MSFIHLYLDKDNNSNDKLINILKNHNINFLQYNIKNNEAYMNAYNLESLPTIKFKNSIIHDVNEDSIQKVVNEFNNFIDTLPTIKSNDASQTKINIKNEEENPNDKDDNLPSQILVNTIKVSDKEKLSLHIKNFSEKYKT